MKEAKQGNPKTTIFSLVFYGALPLFVIFSLPESVRLFNVFGCVLEVIECVWRILGAFWFVWVCFVGV